MLLYYCNHKRACTSGLPSWQLHHQPVVSSQTQPTHHPSENSTILNTVEWQRKNFKKIHSSSLLSCILTGLPQLKNFCNLYINKVKQQTHWHTCIAQLGNLPSDNTKHKTRSNNKSDLLTVLKHSVLSPQCS